MSARKAPMLAVYRHRCFCVRLIQHKLDSGALTAMSREGLTRSREGDRECL